MDENNNSKTDGFLMISLEPDRAAVAREAVRAYAAAIAPGMATLTDQQFLDNLDFYARDPECGYNPAGIRKGKTASGCRAVCCAYLPYLARLRTGYSGATLEWRGGLALKGDIKSLGGFCALLPGMEVFQSGDGGKTMRHMGVYAGSYDFGLGPEPAVYQSVGAEPRTIRLKYAKALGGKGPNLTSMSASWAYWGWPKHVVPGCNDGSAAGKK